MSAVIGPPALTSVAHAHKRVRFGNVEPAVVALLKQLDPAVVVATLFVCMLVAGERFSNFYCGVALMALVTSAAVFSRFAGESGVVTSRTSPAFPRILLQWGAVVSVLLLLAFALKITAALSPRNGNAPVAISYKTAPKENRSLRASRSLARACSGDI